MDRGPGEFASDDEAAQYYLDVLREGSSREKIEARDGLAAVFERRGLLDEAAECYETNILEGVRDPDVYERLARIYRRQGRSDLADEVLDEARRLPPRGAASTVPMAPIPSPPSRAGGPAATQQMPPGSIDDYDYDESPTVEIERPGHGLQGSTPRYASPAVVALCVVFLGPIGLALMWAKAPWSNSSKWIITAVWWSAFLLVMAVMARANLLSIGDIVAGQYGPPNAVQTPVRTPAVPAASPGIVLSPLPAAAKPSPEPPIAAAPSPPAAASPAAKPGVPTPPTVGQVRVARTEGQGVSLRERPSTQANRLKTLNEGTVLDIAGPDIPAEDKVWRNVRDSAGATGWVVSEYLEQVPR